MVSVSVQCPHCQSTEVIKAGKQANEARRYQCHNGQCDRRIFLLHYQDRGRVPEFWRQVVDMALNGSGIRATARVLRMSPTTVIAVLKKVAALRHVNRALLSLPRSRAVRVPVGRAAELDEMWSFVGAKEKARWLWHAVDHHSRRVLAYVVGTRKDAVFLNLQAWLTPFGITRYYTDRAGVYQQHLPPEQHRMGKLSMQKIERKHLTLRTRLKRLARKTLCFSRFSCEARPAHRAIYEPGGIWLCGLKESNYRIETLPFAVGTVGQTVPDQHSRATDIESKPPVQSPAKVFTPPASREEFDKHEELADEPEPRSLSKTPERLDKPLKFRLPRSERSDVMRVVSRIGEQVETSVEWSHVGRALVVLLRHAEGEIVKHARRNGPLVRPSNDQAIALAEFEQRIAQILLRTFREVSPLR